jgi:hypothetical protein
LYKIHISRAFIADAIKTSWKKKVFSRFSFDQIMRNKIKFSMCLIVNMKTNIEVSRAKIIFVWYLNRIAKFKLLLRKLIG